MNEFEELAKRCEQANGPDRELDALIDVKLRIGKPNHPEWVSKNFPKNWRIRSDHRVEVFHNDGKGGVHWEPQRFTESIDAAMALFPNDTGVILYCIIGKKPSVSVQRYEYDDHVNAQTTALALCAAALRIRAFPTGRP